jgi:hypothetical protein
MTDERKNELGEKFIFLEKISIAELKKLELQEIVFLINSVRHFKKEKAFPNINYEQKIKIFLGVISDIIKEAEKLYIAYDKNTNYPYVDIQGRTWIFSKEEYANSAADFYMQQLIMLKIKKIDVDEIQKVFVDLYYMGIEELLIDNGEYSIELNRADIIPPPDYSNIPEISIPVYNPKLQYAIIRFFQMLYTQSDVEDKNRMLHNLEGTMLEEVINAKYLLPMYLKQEEPAIPNEQGVMTIKKGATINIPHLVDKNDKEWLPVFTDWIEFEKVYDKNEWQGNIATYTDLLAFSEKMEGIVINCKGIPLEINEKNKRIIEDYIKSKNNPAAALINENTIEEDTKIMLGEPREYPTKMIEAIKEYMKKQRAIKKAYLRLMVKENEKSYLIVVDFEGMKESVFQGVADAAKPHLNGMFLDMVEMNDWAKSVIRDVEPFYKKKLFGLF